MGDCGGEEEKEEEGEEEEGGGGREHGEYDGEGGEYREDTTRKGLRSVV